MRLLIASLDGSFAERVRLMLYAVDAHWQISLARDGAQALSMLATQEYGLLLLHACLPVVDGVSVLQTLEAWRLGCPPRVLLLCEPEMRHGFRVDCCAPLYAAPARVCALLRTLASEPVPILASARRRDYAREAESFLDSLGMSRRLKGRGYAVWLLCRLAPSPELETRPLELLYDACAREHETTRAAVERCIRVAVESVFMQGSMAGIERHFGATVDPERGKPTNRAFLIQAAARVRLAYSLAETRLPNSMVMHHSPAAPTIV